MCWGTNYDGQLGDGSSGSISSVPVAVLGISDAVAIELDPSTSCALLQSGQIRCWGYGPGCQLGDGTPLALTPVEVLGLPPR